MIFWSIQSVSMWEEAQRVGYLTGHTDHVDEDYREPYDWLVSQMQQRLGIAHSFYPVWMWDFRPDLRAYRRYSGLGPNVLLRLEVDESQVLASSYEVWHCVLNRFPVELYEDEPIDMHLSWERIFNFELLDSCELWQGGNPNKQYTVASVPITNIKAVKFFTGI